MANVLFTGTALTLSAASGNGTNTYILGDASDGVVGTYSVQIFEDTSGTCTFDVVARSRVATGTGAEPPFEPIPYLPLHLNGSVGTYGTGSAAQITTDSLILIPATGLQIALDIAFTDGVFVVYIQRMIGASA